MEENRKSGVIFLNAYRYLLIPQDHIQSDFYTGVTKKGIYYNIVPEGTPAPKGGYYDKKYILSIKGLPDCF